MKRTLLLMLVIALLIAGCAQETKTPVIQEQAEVEEQTTNPPDPTPTEIQPTATQELTNTPELPTLTPLPDGVLFRDDFEGEFQPGWSWINEDSSRWSFVEGGWLEIIGDDMSFWQEGDFGMANFLTREVPDGKFMITAHVQADPNEDFQQATIYIYENQNNFIALNLGYCGFCPTNGPGYYMETFIDNNPADDAYRLDRSPEETDVYLRLVNEGESVVGYYATEPEQWQRVGSFGNYFDFKFVGLGATNANLPDVAQNDIVARFDYFEIGSLE